MENIPLSLIIVYIVFVGLLDTHKRHFKNFRGSSVVFHVLLGTYVIIGFAVKFIFLFYYGYLTIWYIPVFLYIIGGILMGLLFSFFDVMVGELIISLLGFIISPISSNYI